MSGPVLEGSCCGWIPWQHDPKWRQTGRASYRIRELGNGVQVSNRVSDVAIEIARSRDGSLVVFPAWEATLQPGAKRSS
jgi:hypothetical protein